MDDAGLKKLLSDLPIPAVRYFEETGSTNDVAMVWAGQGAEDYSLVFADSQNAGRGRSGHSWHTQPGAALAVSLVLRPRPGEAGCIPLFSPLGAVAICRALDALAPDLQPQIKWPNDVLIQRQKMAGILVEANWLGQNLNALVIGMGINIASTSIPADMKLDFPATCVETCLGRPVDRFGFLHALVSSLIEWRSRLQTQAFLEAWQSRLAFLGETVYILSGSEQRDGRVIGVNADGSLQLLGLDGCPFAVQVGEVHLRLA